MCHILAHAEVVRRTVRRDCTATGVFARTQKHPSPSRSAPSTVHRVLAHTKTSHQNEPEPQATDHKPNDMLAGCRTRTPWMILPPTPLLSLTPRPIASPSSPAWPGTILH